MPATLIRFITILALYNYVHILPSGFYVKVSRTHDLLILIFDIS